MIVWFLFGIIGVLAVILAVVLLRRNSAAVESNDASLHQRFDGITAQIQQQMQQYQLLMQQQMQEHRETLTKTNQHIGTRLDYASSVVNQVQQRLTQLDEGSKRIFEVGKDIASLQDILRAPKLRGSLGELFLGDILSQTLPRDQYVMQYAFKSGEKVDAIVKLRDGLLVPIDAKFPLENMRRYMSVEGEVEKEQMRKSFRNDVKKHIDSIASKYILPSEGTFDFALMYIPAENVYYETIVKDDGEGALLSHAFAKRVIPVSPNTLYIYLQAILLGLKGLKIEQEAAMILKNLQTLSTEFSKFGQSYSVLGNHLQNAQTKYLETERQINKIGLQLDSIDTSTEKLPLK